MLPERLLNRLNVRDLKLRRLSALLAKLQRLLSESVWKLKRLNVRLVKLLRLLNVSARRLRKLNVLVWRPRP